MKPDGDRAIEHCRDSCPRERGRGEGVGHVLFHVLDENGAFYRVTALGSVTFLLEINTSAGARTGFWILSLRSLW